MIIRDYINIYLFLFTVILLASCEKETQHPVPFKEVNFRINLETTFSLNTVGGYEYFTGGVRGIIIYRLSEDEYVALDRACTNNIYEQVSVEDPPIAKCDECGSEYLLLDGSVIEAPAKHNLKRYRTNVLQPYLYVSN